MNLKFTLKQVISMISNCFLPDHRSDDWFLMGSPWHAVAVVALYLYFVKRLGPNLMRNRPAFKLDGVLKVYNLFQIATNMYMLYVVRITSAALLLLGCGRKLA
jgi:hypothetical protein